MAREVKEGRFQLISDLKPQGDQPQAIEKLEKGVNGGKKHQVLLGVTGSGKTFTMANVMARVNKPALVMAPNKTLAAQLYNEFKELFPQNAVRYFVSYYDYYQPEAYVPSTDTYIEKDASINDEIDKLRHSATKALLERRDVVIVAGGIGLIQNGRLGDGYDVAIAGVAVVLRSHRIFSRHAHDRERIAIDVLRQIDSRGPRIPAVQ